MRHSAPRLLRRATGAPPPLQALVELDHVPTGIVGERLPTHAADLVRFADLGVEVLQPLANGVQVVNQEGEVAFNHIGEGAYDELEATVVHLLENGP